MLYNMLQENLDITEMDLRIENNSKAKAMWTDIKINSQKVAIVVLQRPPTHRDIYRDFERLYRIYLSMCHVQRR